MYRRRLHFEELGKALVTHKFIAGSGFHELCCQLIFDRKFNAKNKEHHKAQCQLCEATDNRTPSRCDKSNKYIYVKPIFVTVVRFAQKLTCIYISNQAHTKKKFTTRVNLTGNMKHAAISEHDARTWLFLGKLAEIQFAEF
ncbi:hypothetical protein T02_1651 [Trichinella nativa]|uniref:Uncharacterized protein n=1 Tax=Trichinella nativa TaxID=6335 RepID=A0A0V1LUQ1_9BILA|nr:hypothetical protein T02_10546 [Trichinella nativa]KRZ63273.1 hypothetical protein T02_1651 [Trichinella nativa]